MSVAGGKVLEVVKARHAYSSTVADQMSFAAGDVLHITAKNGGWWRAIKVSNPAEQGWVPSNYLSVVKADGGLEKVMVTPRTAAGQVRPETVVGALSMPQPSPSPQAAAAAAAAFGFGADSATQLPATNGKPLLYGVRTLHRYTAAQADGLSFDAKELLSVIGTKDGWLRCVNAMGIEGWVPSNYTTQVEAVGAAASAVTSVSATGASAAFSAGSGDAGAGVGAGAVFSGAVTSSSSSSNPNLNFSKSTSSSSSVLDFAKPKSLDTSSFGDEAVVSRKSAPPPMEESAGRKSAPPPMDESAGRSSAPPPQVAAEPSAVSMPSPRPDLPPLDANMTPRVDPPTPRAPELPQDSYVATPRVHSASGGGSGSDTPEEEYRDQVGDLTITPRMQQSIGSSAERVRALYNFEPKKPDHLAFKKNDVLVVLKKKGQWYKCHHEHHTTRVGYIPANYVKAIVAAEAMPNPTVLALAGTSTASGAAAAAVVVVADFEPSKERPLLVKASHNYKALANNQISFSKHEMLHVIHKNKGWWKAYRLSDSEKIGYIPSNYVVAQGPADMAAQNGGAGAEGAGAGAGAGAAAGSSSAAASSSLSAAAAAAATAQQLEEIGIALHDLAAKDPKCLALKRDERFTILDKAVGGGWWRCTSLTSGETGLVPSNFLRTEMGVRRAAPPLPAPRGSVPNLSTLFVEGTYDFAAKKSSQLSYKKYDTLVVLKKDGSWWKARNRLGKEGVIPFNYVKEVSPASFTACFDFNATKADELSIVRDEVLTALDLEQPGWWLMSSRSGRGYVPSTYVHPNSTRIAGTSAPPTPRSAIAPDVPSTPRNPDGSTRADPVVAPGASVATPAPVAVEPAIKVEQGVVGGEAIGRTFSGAVSQTPATQDVAKIMDNVPVPRASVVVPRHYVASPAATPRPEFISEHVVPVRGGPRVAPVEEEEGKSSAPAPAEEEADAVAAAAPAAVENSSSSALFKPLGALGGQLTGLFDKVMPSKSAPADAGEDAKSSPPPPAASAGADASSNPLGSVGAGLSNVGNSVGAGLSNVGNSVGAGLSSIGSFFGSALSPAGPQVEGQPNAGTVATSDAAAAAPAAAPAAVPSAAQPAQFGFYEGEGEVRPEGDSNNPLTARPAKPAAHHSTDGSTGSTTSRDGQTNSSTGGSGKEIGSAADPRMRNPNGDLNNRGACGGGWSNWFGIFATCTGNRSNENIPKPVSEEDEKENTTKE